MLVSTIERVIYVLLSYAYDERYPFEANFGYNGSENFREGARFGFSHSIAVGYRISNENFFEPLNDVITNLKIRGSWRIVGNSFTDPRFPYLTFVNLSGKRYTFGDNWQTSGTGAIITKYGYEWIVKYITHLKTQLLIDSNNS